MRNGVLVLAEQQQLSRIIIIRKPGAAAGRRCAPDADSGLGGMSASRCCALLRAVIALAAHALDQVSGFRVCTCFGLSLLTPAAWDAPCRPA